MNGSTRTGVANVLYVDDEAAIRRAVSNWLTRKGHAVHTASDVASARAILADHQVDGVFIDLWLGSESGMTLHDWIRENIPALASRTIIVSGDPASSEQLLKAVRELGLEVLAKPFELRELSEIAAKWQSNT